MNECCGPAFSELYFCKKHTSDDLCLYESLLMSCYLPINKDKSNIKRILPRITGEIVKHIHVSNANLNVAVYLSYCAIPDPIKFNSVYETPTHTGRCVSRYGHTHTLYCERNIRAVDTSCDLVHVLRFVIIGSYSTYPPRFMTIGICLICIFFLNRDYDGVMMTLPKFYNWVHIY